MSEKQAEELDRRFAQSGLTGPLHCVPMIVKDNFETKGLQTTDGALALAGYLPGQRRLPGEARQGGRRARAGQINMAEWAFSPYETVNSILPGYTRNPYALDRVTAGSSGGTAAAIAASLGLVGLGSDTGNSIRGPSSHQALVGIRSTMGLTSRAGVMPLELLADIAGPMARTVEDAVEVFQVIVGEDPERPGDRRGLERIFRRTTRRRSIATACAARSSACCARPTSATPPTRKSCAIFMAAVEDLRRAGATIVDPATGRGPRRDPARRRRGPVHGLQVRSQSLSRRAGRPRAGEEPRRDHPLRALSSLGPAPPGKGREGAGERPRFAGLPGRHGLSREGARGGAEDHGQAQAGRVRLSRRGAIPRG